jgi:hypothetical protein
MSTVIAFARRLAADRRGSVYVGYTSLLLLFALAAVAVLAHHGSFGPN